MQVDHVFVMCDVGAPEAEALARLGLREGPPNTHPGQGTACRRFFFLDTYLELVWVHDEAEARSEGVAPTRLWERWSGRHAGACPFGIVLRDGGDAPPWSTWPYRPSYLPPGEAIAFEQSTTMSQPEILYASFLHAGARAGGAPDDRALSPGSLTHVRVDLPDVTCLSPAASRLQADGIAEFAAGRYLLHLAFDGAGPGRRADLRPALDVILDW